MKRFIKTNNLFENLFLKIKNLAIISAFCILLYRVKASRQICIAICQYIAEWYTDFDLITIKNLYLCLENIFRIIILLYLLFAIIMFLVHIIWDWCLEKKVGKNRFEESMFRYLHDSNTSRCFLVTGKWGSGKTHEVKMFFDKYYSYSKIKVYRISCFGLNSRNDLTTEISNTIEQKDSSLYALIVKVLQFLPVIGEPISKFLKKSYGYNSVKKGSIFIFDDFERITSRSVTNMNSKHIYRKSHFGAFNDAREFKQIKEEFRSVEKAISTVEDFINKNLEREDLDKYIAVVGLINELVEIYEMKVIIVCNSDILGEKFVHEVLRSKLNCLEYKKVTNPEVKMSIINNILTNKTFDEREKQESITDYLIFIKDNIDDIIVDEKFTNLRLLSGLLEAFVDTAILFDKNKLTREFMNSLFHSIMIAHWAYYNNSVKWLDLFITGANIQFLMELFLEQSLLPKVIRISDYVEDVRWIDISISGYWIFNMSLPSDIDINTIIEMWSSYGYFGLEKRMLNNYQALMSETNYDLVHVIYYQKNYNGGQIWNYSSYIENILKSYDLSRIENVQIILDIVGQAFDTNIYHGFLSFLYEKLAEGNANGTIIGNTHIHRGYNEYLQGKWFM